MNGIVRFAGFLAFAIVMAASGIWGVLALFIAGPPDDLLSDVLGASFAAVLSGALIGLFFRRWRWHITGLYLLCLAVVLAWWSSIEPSNSRDWQTDVAILPSATIERDIVTVHNIRNFDYRSETDYTPSYYDRRFDLRELQGVDIVAVYWMGPAISHIFLSFAFNNGEHLAVSIETRKEKGEDYSTIKGFFRRYELYYVVADERDVIRLRTNYRNQPVEDVYVYRAAGAIEDGRRLFLSYMNKINALHSQPEFYNTLTTNCTTSIWLNTHVNENHLPFDWKILVSGYLPELLYESGKLQTDGLGFSELQRSVHVNDRAKAADTDAGFSQRIRAKEILP